MYYFNEGDTNRSALIWDQFAEIREMPCKRNSLMVTTNDDSKLTENVKAVYEHDYPKYVVRPFDESGRSCYE